ncbi:hypothetical protein QBC46DRAFT_453744 [Diplogelasinospora grovesii]|uniref:Uncharacterized protein n=1 Tax=Diplogelasinospora grovesii TaxID=303347 RepID=A0AAN6MX35_9PEZI|nr:hypothetical protein QBC46DRAFT_453744 [Diplogelasinospora grovesii]
MGVEAPTYNVSRVASNYSAKTKTRKKKRRVNAHSPSQAGGEFFLPTKKISHPQPHRPPATKTGPPRSNAALLSEKNDGLGPLRGQDSIDSDPMPAGPQGPRASPSKPHLPACHAPIAGRAGLFDLEDVTEVEGPQPSKRARGSTARGRRMPRRAPEAPTADTPVEAHTQQQDSQAGNIQSTSVVNTGWAESLTDEGRVEVELLSSEPSEPSDSDSRAL